MKSKNYKAEDNDNDIWLSNFPKTIRKKLAVKEEISLCDLQINQQRFDNIAKIDISKIHTNEHYRPYNNKYLRKRISGKTQSIVGKTPQDRSLDNAALGKDLWALSENNISNPIPTGKINISTNKSFNNKPVFLDGLEYSVIIGDEYIYIGCQGNTIEKWKNMSDQEIMKMDGKKSLIFWKKYKSVIIKLAQIHLEKKDKDYI